MSAQLGHKVHEFYMNPAEPDAEPRCAKCGKTFYEAIMSPVCQGAQAESNDESQPETEIEQDPEQDVSAIQIDPILYQEHFLRLSPDNHCPTCGEEHPTLVVSKCHPKAPMFVAWDAERAVLVMTCSVCGGVIGHVCVAEAAYERWKALSDDDECESNDNLLSE